MKLLPVFVCSLFLAMSLVLRAGYPTSADQVDQLRCEYLVNPIGIDVAKPRLSWILTAPDFARGVPQQSYHILVASSPELLEKNQGDLWDSGEVKSSETTFIEYGGSPLVSRERCFWKVTIKDTNGNFGGGAPASWEMGLLKPEDWQAKWIEAPPITQPAPTGSLKINSATYEAADGAGSMDVRARLAAMVKDNALTVNVDNESLGGDPALKHRKQLHVVYNVGERTYDLIVPEKTALTLPFARPSLPILRKDFAVTKPIATARLYATALGLYELHLNGQRVGDHIFAPDWADYNKRVRYQDYDVTSLVKHGPNALAGMVGNGWYSGHIGNGGFQAWGTMPALYAQLEITYTDGTVDRIVTDSSWLKHSGPITSSDFMLGENYDGVEEVFDWDQPSIDDSSWEHVSERTETRHLDGQVDQPVRQLGELKPKSVKEIKPGHWIYDFGQNMVGFVRLKAIAPAGTRVTLRHAEMLNPDGTLYVANLRGASAIDTYICPALPFLHATAEQTRKLLSPTWQPHFTFHGFRYVEVSGLKYKPGKDAVTAIVVGTDIPPTGKFACSNEMIDQLQSNIQWGMRGNYLSVPTDCPQRDERMGWMGDAQVFIRTAAYNGDVAAFFTKWLVDVDDAQLPDGEFSNVAPSPVSKWSHGGGPAWADAGVICPWTIYLMYGDKRILQQHLPAMKRWVDWCQSVSPGLIRNGPDHGYGDWLSQGENTPKDLIGTAFFAYSTLLMAKSCAVVGDPDAAKYEQLAGQIRTAFNQKYVAPDGKMTGDTQAGYAMALRFNLLPDELRPKAAQYLEDNVKAHGNHLTTGFVGVSYLLPALTAQGKTDTAYSLLLQDTFPSWLFSVKHGATTIWERWDGWTPDKGFQDPSMNSFNHYSLGSCGEWMFDSVAGIGVDPDSPGFSHIIIHPRPDAKLKSAEGSFDSIHGRIATKWSLKGHKLTLDVTIPVNTTAEIILPAGSQSPSSKPEIKAAPAPDGTVHLPTGSGSYHVTCDVP